VRCYIGAGTLIAIDWKARIACALELAREIGD
jgi:hypothetical protein